MKLFNYFDFLFEGAESPREIAKMKIYYSDRFRDLLTKIASNKSTDNETPRMVAEFLLAGEDSNQALDIYTLIDTTDKNDKISFVQVNRIARDTGLKDLTSFKVGSDYKFWKDGRTPEYGVGRWVRHIFVDVQKVSLDDNQLELFVNAYKSVYDLSKKSVNSIDLSVVQGESIKTYYLDDNYLLIKGQLGNSCMRYEKCQPYLDIYVENPEVCKLLVLKEKVMVDGKEVEKVKGRALLWILSDGRKYMDRIYAIEDSDKNIFKDWAKDNKYNLTFGLDTSGEELKVNLKVKSFSKYPYMDTFEYYDEKSGILYENKPELDEDSEILRLKETDGRSYLITGSHEGQVRDIDGDWIDEDEAHFCDDVNGWVYYENTYWLDYKDIYVSDRVDVKYSNYHESYFYESDLEYNEEADEYYYPEWTIAYKINPDEDSYIPKEYYSYYIELDGINYSRKNYIIDPYTGELRYRFERVDGRKYEDILDEQIKSELGLPERLKTKELEEFRKVLVNDIIKNRELAKDEIKRIRDFYKRHNATFNQSWYYYLAPIIYNIVYNDENGLKKSIEYADRNKALELTLKIVDQLGYKESTNKEIKKWLEGRFNELYWSTNIFTIVEQISSTFFGDVVYKKCLYLSI